MSRWLVLLVAAIVSVGVLAGTASATSRDVAHGRPTTLHFTYTDVTFPDAYLTTACGFDVNETWNMKTTGTFWLNSEGVAVREFDTYLGSLTYSAPKFGNSTVRPVAVVAWTDYGTGAYIGQQVKSTVIGSGAGTVSFIGPPGTGTLVTVGEVADFLGIVPLVSPESVVFASGDFDLVTHIVCNTLHG